MQTIHVTCSYYKWYHNWDPEALMQIDIAKLARNILREGDMSSDVIRDLREVEQMKQQMEQQQQLQGMAQQITNEQQPNRRTTTLPKPKIKLVQGVDYNNPQGWWTLHDFIQTTR